MGVRVAALEGLVTSTQPQAAADPRVPASGLARTCRSCGTELTHTFADLGSSPLANSYLTAEQLAEPEPFYPLRVFVCERCFLVQLPPVVTPGEIFDDYAYFSSFSDTLLQHSRDYAQRMIGQLGLDSSSLVVEIASNDGYLLRNFAEHDIPVLGIEPARNVATAAEAAGIPTRVEFFTAELAETLSRAGEQADLVVANNVLAHVPELNGFVAGLRTILAPGGVVTVEFPHVLRLIERTEFDTIYHEHLSYFSLLAVERPFRAAGLSIVDVEELPTHGGSLRIHACHEAEASEHSAERVEALREREREAELDRLETYSSFDDRVRRSKRRLLEFLISAKREGKSIVGYGAAAKATTLLNYCGIRSDFVDYVADRSPHKQGRFLPGTHLPIRPPEEIASTKPDYLILFAWNLADEIVRQLPELRELGCRFVIPVPEPTVLD
jgi:2-polyprenyl-3-methyl-5-hydroxy-6-metoxy-1,4-benzoquinol methylase